jgi:hypothetical protein
MKADMADKATKNNMNTLGGAINKIHHNSRRIPENNNSG